jgi:hypothetical protein
MKVILDAVAEGRCICKSGEAGERWSDSETLAVAGACMAELLRRREETQVATTDEPLRVDMEWPYTRMTKRMETALNFAIQQACVARDCYRDPTVDSDKTYRVEIVYTRPGFETVSVKNTDEVTGSANGSRMNPSTSPPTAAA